MGLYQWNDNSLKTFDSTDIRWCKRNMVLLGYQLPEDSPTQKIYSNGDAEKCVLSRRGKGSVQMLCFEDTLCRYVYPFICERCM